MTPRRRDKVTLLTALLLTAPAVAADPATPPEQVADNGDAIVVTGTRQQAQTQYQALSPVDVFSGHGQVDRVEQRRGCAFCAIAG